MGHRIVVAGIVAAVLLAGCGSEPGGPTLAGDADGDGPATPSEGQVADDDDPAMIDCGGSQYGLADLDAAPGVSSLTDEQAGAVDDAGAPAFDASQDWRVVHSSETRVELVRELDEPLDSGGGDVRTHESRVLQRITGATNVPDGTWMLTSAGPCAQRVVSGDRAGDADLTLAAAPSPDDTTIELLVRERACASGRTAEGRIELLELDETDQQVRLRIGVRPPDGDQDCQGNPPTPFTVELTEPLGQREIVDASVVPARVLTVAEVGDGA